MNELIRLRCEVLLSDYEPDTDWEEGYEVAAPTEFQKTGEETVQFEWYVENSESEKKLRDMLSRIPFLPEPSRDEITSSDWQSYWKQHFKVQRIGRRMLVVPEWEKENVVTEPDDCVLLIRPGLGFGTGDHFTTSYCLAALENYQGSATTFADVGTGSGILAAAAVKLGYQDVLAFDHDRLACEAAMNTFELNGVSGQVTLECCDLLERDPFCADLVCANLFDSTLIQFAGRLARSVSGILVLTGIRTEKLEEVKMAYQPLGLEILDEKAGKEWAGLVLSHTHPSRDLLPDQDSIESVEC